VTDTTEPPEHPDDTFARSPEEINAAFRALLRSGIPALEALHPKYVRRALYTAWLVRHGQGDVLALEEARQDRDRSRYEGFIHGN
jgi:hypothetical protein